MVEEATLTEGGVAVAEPPKEAAPPQQKKQDEDLEYEVEFATPFGNLEFEFEPLQKKEKKDKERKEKAEREAAQKALKAAERAAQTSDSGGRGLIGTLLIIFIVLGVLGAITAVAYWLFARPGEDEDEAVPPELAYEPQPSPQGFVARARGRVQDALRAGRQASRDAQREQREKFEQMSGGR
jgi:hypothetical protein